MTITEANKILKILTLDLYEDLTGCEIKLAKGELMDHYMESEFTFFNRYIINIDKATLLFSTKEFTAALAHQLSKIVEFRNMSLPSKVKDMFFSRYSPSYYVDQEKKARTMLEERSKKKYNADPVSLLNTE